jgi:hypothetical protein
MPRSKLLARPAGYAAAAWAVALVLAIALTLMLLDRPSAAGRVACADSGPAIAA